jgi:hypothetical protein
VTGNVAAAFVPFLVGTLLLALLVGARNRGGLLLVGTYLVVR